MRYRLIVEYDGTDFHGWQLQPDARSVQGVLEEAVHRLFGENARVNSAGRTDAGVHALGQVVAFSVAGDREPETVVRAMNALTPEDVAIVSAERVAENFDPRRHARSRTYVYRLWTRSEPSAFWRRWTWHTGASLSMEAMAEAAACLLGEHDFTSFRAAGCDAQSPVRHVYRSEFRRVDDRIEFEIEATAFLRHMVRNIVGTLVEVGSGKRTPAQFGELLAKRNRALAAGTCPPQGLCLTAVRYDSTDADNE